MLNKTSQHVLLKVAIIRINIDDNTEKLNKTEANLLYTLRNYGRNRKGVSP